MARVDRPDDGSSPEIPHQIGVLTPAATRMQRLALRWLTRRPAQRIAVEAVSESLRLAAAAIALIGLLAGLFAVRRGVPLDVALPAMLLAPLLAEHLPDRLDARMVAGVVACRYLQRLVVLHTSLVQAADGSDRYELRRSAEVGQGLLRDVAGLLQTPGQPLGLSRPHRPRTADAPTRRPGQTDPQAQRRGRHSRHEPGLRPWPTSGAVPAWPPADDHPTVRHAPHPPLQKGTFPMTQPEPAPAIPTTDVYLLFAHEPYYPAVAQEINTTVVAAASLLHPRVRQPDGARIHDRLVHGRQPGEIVPLSTLTHELDGGARWPEVGDWESVTEDLLQLIRDHDCDALSLGLPDIARALVCAGPHSEVRAVDPTSGAHRSYGPADRIEVLVEVGRHLTWAEAGSPLWPGDGLLSSINSRDAS